MDLDDDEHQFEMILDVGKDHDYLWHIAVVHHCTGLLPRSRYPSTWTSAQVKASGMTDSDLRRREAVIHSLRIAEMILHTESGFPITLIRLRDPSDVDRFVKKFSKQYLLSDKEIRDRDASLDLETGHD